MRNHRLYGFVITVALAIVLSPAFSSAQARGEQPADAGAPAGRGARGARGGRGGQPAPPSAPTPHWSDGRVNLDATPGAKGFWNVMQGNVVGKGGSSLPTNLTLDEVPFQDWARAL